MCVCVCAYVRVLTLSGRRGVCVYLCVLVCVYTLPGICGLGTSWVATLSSTSSVVCHSVVFRASAAAPAACCTQMQASASVTCHIWMSRVTYGCVGTHRNDSCQIGMSRVAYEWGLIHVCTHHITWMHVTWRVHIRRTNGVYVQVKSHVYVTCIQRIWRRHVNECMALGLCIHDVYRIRICTSLVHIWGGHD